MGDCDEIKQRGNVLNGLSGRLGGGGGYQSALKDFEAKKSNEISRVCHRHFSEFVDSVEELMKMKTDFVSLRDQVKHSAVARRAGVVH